MSTCVFYIDESGSTKGFSIPVRPDLGETAVFCLYALALPLEDWRNFDRDYLRLKWHFFEKEINESRHRAELWEVKGNELCAPRNRDSQRRHAFLREVFDLCGRYGATGFGVAFLKDYVNPMASESCYTLGLQYLAERFNFFLSESRIYDNGILIADERMKDLDFNVAQSYLSYVFGNVNGRLLTCLAESPLFANSRLTSGLQIVDNIAAVFFADKYNYYCRDVPGAPDYSHISKWYWPRLKNLEFKSRQVYDGHIQYGYKICDHRSYPRQQGLDLGCA